MRSAVIEMAEVNSPLLPPASASIEISCRVPSENSVTRRGVASSAGPVTCTRMETESPSGAVESKPLGSSSTMRLRETRSRLAVGANARSSNCRPEPVDANPPTTIITAAAAITQRCTRLPGNNPSIDTRWIRSATRSCNFLRNTGESIPSSSPASSTAESNSLRSSGASSSIIAASVRSFSTRNNGRTQANHPTMSATRYTPPLSIQRVRSAITINQSAAASSSIPPRNIINPALAPRRNCNHRNRPRNASNWPWMMGLMDCDMNGFYRPQTPWVRYIKIGELERGRAESSVHSYQTQLSPNNPFRGE